MDLLEDEDVILLDAEEEDSGVIQVNYYLFFLAPILYTVTKIFHNVSTRISQFFFHPNAAEQRKYSELGKTKGLMQGLSMTDDFAAYSKLQRKVNQITLELEADGLARKALQTDLARMIKFGLYACVGAIYVFTFFWYGSKMAVIVLPFDWFYPLGPILSYPTGIPGALSLPMWTLLVRTVLAYF